MESRPSDHSEGRQDGLKEYLPTVRGCVAFRVTLRADLLESSCDANEYNLGIREARVTATAPRSQPSDLETMPPAENCLILVVGAEAFLVSLACLALLTPSLKTRSNERATVVQLVRPPGVSPGSPRPCTEAS
jgi:hypothetical protein